MLKNPIQRTSCPQYWVLKFSICYQKMSYIKGLLIYSWMELIMLGYIQSVIKSENFCTKEWRQGSCMISHKALIWTEASFKHRSSSSILSPPVHQGLTSTDQLCFRCKRHVLEYIHWNKFMTLKTWFNPHTSWERRGVDKRYLHFITGETAPPRRAQHANWD